MNRKKIRNTVFLGIAAVLSLLLSVWYENVYRDGRLVKPMDFSTYEFRASDLPMLLSVGFVCFYVFYLVYILLRFIRKNWKQEKNGVRRTLNPKLGFLGFLGLLGFLGIVTYRMNGQIFPFSFFVFFGFFGFFYEGKMSGTLIDERLLENAWRAQLSAMKVGFFLICLLLLIVSQGRLIRKLDYIAIAFVAGIALIVALVLFLSEYFLYRYDCGDSEEE